MKYEKVLVTGGAGFIGSHTVDSLIDSDYAVHVVDNLIPQVHGHEKRIPSYFNKTANLTISDVSDTEVLLEIIQDVDAIIHLAARVGVAQSMCDIEKYIEANTTSTASMLNLLVNEKNTIEKLIVASSMSIYGEGKYYCGECDEKRYPTLRSAEQLEQKIWEHLCPNCNSPLTPLPTDETKPQMPSSIYAMSKRHQEEMCLLIGKTYGIPTIALRYLNVYGPRQSLSNPYTGVCAIFSQRILNQKPPFVFEDGKQVRDFIHVRDVAKANILALESNSANYQLINIGTGHPTSILKIAELLNEMFHTNMAPFTSGQYRTGDVRHCYGDITKARNLLDFEPSISLEQGLPDLVNWSQRNKGQAQDFFEKAYHELKSRGLT
jgi:dTDP-L-rhamnose 4-epimerase